MLCSIGIQRSHLFSLSPQHPLLRPVAELSLKPPLIPRENSVGNTVFRRICAAPRRTAGAAEARRAEAVVAKRLAQRFVLGVRSGSMY